MKKILLIKQWNTSNHKNKTNMIWNKKHANNNKIETINKQKNVI